MSDRLNFRKWHHPVVEHPVGLMCIGVVLGALVRGESWLAPTLALVLAVVAERSARSLGWVRSFDRRLREAAAALSQLEPLRLRSFDASAAGVAEAIDELVPLTPRSFFDTYFERGVEFPRVTLLTTSSDDPFLMSLRCLKTYLLFPVPPLIILPYSEADCKDSHYVRYQVMHEIGHASLLGELQSLELDGTWWAKSVGIVAGLALLPFTPHPLVGGLVLVALAVEGLCSTHFYQMTAPEPLAEFLAVRSLKADRSMLEKVVQLQELVLARGVNRKFGDLEADEVRRDGLSAWVHRSTRANAELQLRRNLLSYWMMFGEKVAAGYVSMTEPLHPGKVVTVPCAILLGFFASRYDVMMACLVLVIAVSGSLAFIQYAVTFVKTTPLYLGLIGKFYGAALRKDGTFGSG